MWKKIVEVLNLATQEGDSCSSYLLLPPHLLWGNTPPPAQGTEQALYMRAKV